MSDIISTNRELDAACAAALGKAWTRPTHGRCCTCQDCGWDHDNCQCGYSENEDKAILLEDEIDRRGLQEQYCIALVPGYSSTGPMDADDLWYAIRATPEQKARAFLEAIK